MNRITHFLKSLLLCIVLYTFTACGEKAAEQPVETSSDIVVSKKDDTFELNMYLDKDTYQSDEVIDAMLRSNILV